MRKFTIERRGYSRSPWRIIDSQTGAEVPGPLVTISTWNGDITTEQCGWDTKAEAIEYLGVLAARAWFAQ